VYVSFSAVSAPVIGSPMNDPVVPGGGSVNVRNLEAYPPLPQAAANSIWEAPRALSTVIAEVSAAVRRGAIALGARRKIIDPTIAALIDLAVRDAIKDLDG